MYNYGITYKDYSKKNDKKDDEDDDKYLASFLAF